MTAPILIWLALTTALAGCQRGFLPRPAAALPITNVWAGHPVDFDLITINGRQFAAFYDADRWMTIAARSLSSPTWDFVSLPSQLGWDSHNYITIAIESAGFIHVSGNMHNDPLVYFRSTNAWDIHSFVRVPQMTGDREGRCTQPRFIHGPHGEFIFTYRYGGSGDAINFYNIYDPLSQTWRRLLDVPLLSGEGLRSAYPFGPVPGPDGYFHLVWVWRDSPDCASNHDLCYARSTNLVHWETSAGAPLSLPITFAHAEVVDPVPVNGGMLNGNTMLSFDAHHRPVIAYHKFDEQGFTQLYYARLEDGRWRIYRGTDWRYRWDFSGWGTIQQDIKFRPLVRASNGMFLQWYEHVIYGRSILVFNERFEPQGLLDAPMRPLALETPAGSFPGLRVQWCAGRGETHDRLQFWLRWETLDYNRDKPRDPPWPPPSLLTMHAFPPLHTLPVRRLRPIPVHTNIAPRAALSNLISNGDFSAGFAHWYPWQRGKDHPQLMTISVVSNQHFLRIENPLGALIGVQQQVLLQSGAVYCLSATVRSCARSDPKTLFGARVALYAPPEPERELVWMSEHNQWWRKHLVFTNFSTVPGVLFAHMGYGNVTSTGEFTAIRLEQF